jgi:hypothetical protein
MNFLYKSNLLRLWMFVSNYIHISSIVILGPGVIPEKPFKELWANYNTTNLKFIITDMFSNNSVKEAKVRIKIFKQYALL